MSENRFTESLLLQPYHSPTVAEQLGAYDGVPPLYAETFSVEAVVATDPALEQSLGAVGVYPEVELVFMPGKSAYDVHESVWLSRNIQQQADILLLEPLPNESIEHSVAVHKAIAMGKLRPNDPAALLAAENAYGINAPAKLAQLQLLAPGGAREKQPLIIEHPAPLEAGDIAMPPAPFADIEAYLAGVSADFAQVLRQEAAAYTDKLEAWYVTEAAQFAHLVKATIAHKEPLHGASFFETKQPSMTGLYRLENTKMAVAYEQTRRQLFEYEQQHREEPVESQLPPMRRYVGFSTIEAVPPIHIAYRKYISGQKVDHQLLALHVLWKEHWQRLSNDHPEDSTQGLTNMTLAAMPKIAALDVIDAAWQQTQV